MAAKCTKQAAFLRVAAHFEIQRPSSFLLPTSGMSLNKAFQAAGGAMTSVVRIRL